MDEPDVYERRSDDGRRVIEESAKEVVEETTDKKAVEQDKRRMSRCMRRAERKGGGCRCGETGAESPRGKKNRKRRGKQILSQNPFIIFYLEMYYQMPGKHVTEVARQAGKEWCALPEAERTKYIRLAERERKRRRRGTKGRRRRRGCGRS
ncbi:PREDICTED: protamine-like [Wasmannia auropunctata]|uniref:protamine-like n=1 Tax=Wasmannia auropunctata TaxID=64793 RepID=UPI0005EE0DFE|nr:PREDICTED: protamine-like [Wasmannia auropunctata]